MARNKANAKAVAIDLPPEKVLIFRAGPTSPQSTYSPVCLSAESIFVEADTDKKEENRHKQRRSCGGSYIRTQHLISVLRGCLCQVDGIDKECCLLLKMLCQ